MAQFTDAEMRQPTSPQRCPGITQWDWNNIIKIMHTGWEIFVISWEIMFYCHQNCSLASCSLIRKLINILSGVTMQHILMNAIWNPNVRSPLSLLICHSHNRSEVFFEILWQWYQRELCKIQKRLDNYNGIYGRQTFREIWVSGAHPMCQPKTLICLFS